MDHHPERDGRVRRLGGLDRLHSAVIPLLVIIVLPAWLVVTGRPEMIVPKPVADRQDAAGASSAYSPL